MQGFIESCRILAWVQDRRCKLQELELKSQTPGTKESRFRSTLNRHIRQTSKERKNHGKLVHHQLHQHGHNTTL